MFFTYISILLIYIFSFPLPLTFSRIYSRAVSRVDSLWFIRFSLYTVRRSRAVVLQFRVIYRASLYIGSCGSVKFITGREKVVEKESKLKARFRVDPVHRHRRELARLSALNARRRVASSRGVASRSPAYLRSTAEIITWETRVHHTRNRGESSLFAYWPIAVYASRK